MVSLDISQTSKALAVSGGYVSTFGLVSYFAKERLFISEALIALLAGIIFGPIALDWFNPAYWTSDLNYLTYQITRIIIGIQVLFTGIALPKAYLYREWLSLATLLGPVMLFAWFITSLLIWGLFPGLSYLEALVIGSCVTPTDPVLANTICKGRFAEKNVPLHVRNIILAESGANDGLGYPFLYIGLYLILIHEPSHPRHSVGGAVLEWFYNIVLYDILLSCILGALIGYIARKILRFAEERQLIDHESFLSFGVALTFFTLGVVGIIGSDDILCCFVVGNAFTWDDWFRVETEDHAFQDVIDQLLNTGIFLYIGAVLPWDQFSNFAGITPWRLVVLGITVMLVRRLPWVVALVHFIPALPTWREAVFAGFFGPIGVGAIFYTQVALSQLPDDGTREHLRNVIAPITYFLVFTSVVVHGVTIPIGKGLTLAHSRTLTLTRSQNGLTEPADRVSRLPAPLPFGSDALRSQAENTVAESKNRNDLGPSIRFDLNEEGGNESPRKGKSNGIMTESSTPSHSSSRPSTPPQMKKDRLGDAGHDDDRDTPAEIEQGESWVEGDNVVIESDDGEDVRVEPRRGTN